MLSTQLDHIVSVDINNVKVIHTLSPELKALELKNTVRHHLPWSNLSAVECRW